MLGAWTGAKAAVGRSSAGLPEAGVRMRHKYPVVGHVHDVDGALWGVRDVRGTKHGFDLLYGSPVSRFGSYVSGLPRLIATQPLWDFWDANRTKRDGAIYDLPAGRTTLKRVRA